MDHLFFLYIFFLLCKMWYPVNRFPQMSNDVFSTIFLGRWFIEWTVLAIIYVYPLNILNKFWIYLSTFTLVVLLIHNFHIYCQICLDLHFSPFLMSVFLVSIWWSSQFKLSQWLMIDFKILSSDEYKYISPKIKYESESQFMDVDCWKGNFHTQTNSQWYLNYNIVNH